ncbi:hypothetical protein B0J11DRAFT_224632 [Dendryphion nanum]|uniref:Amine oxidase domain-containing protein n=1 Tax=Dendryphion nanum TaxID=256645 RepID=A0A9P9IT37_9PLEO|nr:hypothetical protein B0J11DRAFT_224632 [Dendryphion nanum]
MEHRTYNCNGSGQSEKMQRDLSSSPHQEEILEENGEFPMIRRAISRIPHVCIVGAGLAGLRCADILLNHGVKVTILEGRNRIGGRVSQSDALGHSVDLGPNWIHGTETNPILDLAKETNTVVMNWDGRQAMFDQTGKDIEEKETAEIIEVVWSIIEQAMKYSNDHSAEISAERSLYDFFQEQVQKAYPSLIENDKEAQSKRERILQHAEMWGAFVGSPIQTQSLKFFWMEECIDGENLFVAGTYKKILEKIARPVLKGANIIFNTKVVKITSSNTDEELKLIVSTDTEDKLSFDEVVMTAPLGWLKKNKQSFEPALPSRLNQAIDAIGYGHLDKVYIKFPTAFWNESYSNAIVSNEPQTSHNVVATIAPLNQGSIPPINPNHWPGFTIWSSPRYAPDTNPSHWNQECINLAALPADTAHPTLLFYTFGPTSLHLASLLSAYSSPDSPPAQELLKEFFHPYFSRLPNYSASDPSHQPEKLLATAWANDELAGFGSYANFQTGLENGDKDVEAMRRGLPERGLWLAGEHTAPFVALGTATGAYWAGEGVAKRIAKAYGLKGERGGDGSGDSTDKKIEEGHVE